MAPLFHVLMAILVIVIAARSVGALFARLGQPPVIGEMIAGLLLGPSFFGQVAPAAAAFVLPQQVLPSLGMLAQIGVVLFMFLVGLELDTSELRKHRRASLMISGFSVLLPFVLGIGLAVFLHSRFASAGTARLPFVLFIGAAMSVTAFPVLARIVRDSGLAKEPIGVLALACAAIDDVSAWCLLAFATSAADGSLGSALATVVMTAALVGMTVLVGRPLLLKAVASLEQSGEPIGRSAVAYALIALLLMAMLAEGIGIHAVFGAFLAGLVVPHDSKLALALQEKLEDVVMIVFLPPFFAFSGMRTQLGLVAGLEPWLWTIALIAVASLGKVGGTVTAARFTGYSWRDSTSLGLLMNTRGAVGLVVLNIGLDLKILSPTVFAMMVLMAVTTTFATPPILKWVRRAPG
ncbi:MAG: Sodium/hydrogen exchanger [Myxococcaceae bacterium]|nr:Sodium/hydrogen exchanger [Myxococcaceae bacterium]